MNKKLKRMLSLFTISLLGSGFTMSCNTNCINTYAASKFTRQVEDLSRGVAALKTKEGVYLSWRSLGTDVENLNFDVYRNGQKINTESISDSTNYLDTEGDENSIYYIKAINGNSVKDISKEVKPMNSNFFDIPISAPDGGVTPKGDSYTYSAGDASVSDLDGDGEYEIILKWDPSNAKDNSASGYTGNVYIDAYKLDGTRLWRIDLGRNIRAGSHYTQFMVYDYDGDGYGELVCKTADGTKDGRGNYIGDRDADYRTKNGTILSGPEYLTLFDGRSGEAVDTINYEVERGNVKDWGDNYGNRSERYLGAVAYLNGKTPSVVMCRGYYSRVTLSAYDIVNKKLVKRWIFDSNDEGNSAYAGQGNHNLAVADVDNDGYDEIVYGSCTIDHDGKGLYSTGLGHGDAVHVGDFLPSRPGLEVWGCLESGQHGSALWDAATGEILLRHTSSGDTGRSIAGNFVPGNDSVEFASSASSDVYDASGNVVCKWSEIQKFGQNFALYWNGDLEQETFDKKVIQGYKNHRYLLASGVTTINHSKSTPCLSADILGDWREEVILPTYDSSALRVYSTNILTSYKIPTLMHDTQYRCQVASQNVGYNMYPCTSFFLGTGYPLPDKFNVYDAVAKNK